MPPPGQRVQNVVHGKRRKQAVQPCRSGAITARRIHAESRSSLIPRNLLHGSHPALILFFFFFWEPVARATFDRPLSVSSNGAIPPPVTQRDSAADTWTCPSLARLVSRTEPAELSLARE